MGGTSTSWRFAGTPFTPPGRSCEGIKEVARTAADDRVQTNCFVSRNDAPCHTINHGQRRRGLISLNLTGFISGAFEGPTKEVRDITGISGTELRDLFNISSVSIILPKLALRSIPKYRTFRYL
ncbi:hypothetical protein L596_007101 [Steinernema carpocapsae]|uniref:Uncharacterized protein n=1 Tax=Steinernema carpocapsae TaxID=34508 RepID=A0A4U5P9A0_STECR|nr:hypothetical protein L596_007101 [Steinernema carpocapsae]